MPSFMSVTDKLRMQNKANMEPNKDPDFQEQMKSEMELGVYPFGKMKRTPGKSLLKDKVTGDNYIDKLAPTEKVMRLRDALRPGEVKKARYSAPKQLPTPNAPTHGEDNNYPDPGKFPTPNVNKTDMERIPQVDKHYRNLGEPSADPTPNIPDHYYQLKPGEQPNKVSELFKQKRPLNSYDPNANINYDTKYRQLENQKYDSNTPEGMKHDAAKEEAERIFRKKMAEFDAQIEAAKKGGKK